MRGILAILLVLFGLLSQFSALGQDGETEARMAFAEALNDLRAREQNARHAQFAYTQTLQDQDNNRVVRRFDPLKQEEEWSVLHQEGKDLTNMQIQWSVPLQLNSQTVEALSASYCTQTESHWGYCGAAPVQVDMEDGQAPQNLDSLMQENLQTRIWVDKHQLRFSRMTIHNLHPLRPSPLARVKQFDIQLEFSPAWSQGPLLTQRASRRLEGSYGFFISIDEHLIQSLSDIRQVESGG